MAKYFCDNCGSTEFDPTKRCGCGTGLWLKFEPSPNIEEESVHPVNLMRMSMYVVDLNNNLSREDLEILIEQKLNGISTNCMVRFFDYESVKILWNDEIDLNYTYNDNKQELYDRYFE
jgi:hypothetical protein